MSDRPIALIIEDDKHWIGILEEIFESKFEVKKAKSLSEATMYLSNVDGRAIKKIAIAIVDIVLEKGAPDRSGVDVLHMLRLRKIPSIAISAYYSDDAKAVRDALVLGGAKDFWFKTKATTADLRDIVEGISGESFGSANALNSGRTLLKFSLILILLTAFAFILLTAVTLLTPQNLVVYVMGVGITLTVILIVSLAVMINKITGQQYIGMLKNLLRRG